MLKKINLKTNDLPKKMADLIHSNQFLKLFSFGSLALLILSFVTIIVMATKAPEIIAFDLQGNKIESEDLPHVKQMIEKAIRQYIRSRYEWTPKDVILKLKSARSFITGSSQSAYNASTLKVAEFSVSKKVSQLAYPTAIEIDLKKSVARISGERITSIMGVRAAGQLKLELHFKSGPHTKANPWGVYIAREVELL